MILSTLCYIEKDGKYLRLHRTKKKNDINDIMRIWKNEKVFIRKITLLLKMKV